MIVMTAVKQSLLVASALILLGLAILLIPPTLHLVPGVRGSNRTVTLIGSASGWNVSTSSNPTIRVVQGDTVMTKLTSIDTTHQFALDVDKDGPMFIGSCPIGDDCSTTFNPTTPASGSITVSFPPGTYKYYCTFHSTMVGDFIVQAPPPDFSIAPSQGSLSIPQGSSGGSTITVTSQNGFGGTISLSASVSPTGPTASLNPTSATISSGSSGTSALTVSTIASTPSGAYTITISGTNGTVTRTTIVSVMVTVPDFTIAVNPTSLDITQGSTATTTITLASLNGFSGIVNLTATVSPSGPILSFSSASVTLLSGGTATSMLTISAAGGLYSSVADGNYSVSLTATNGTVSHQTTVEATVGSSSSSPSGSVNLPLTVLGGAAVVIIAVAGIAVYLVRRKKATK